jgi:hypothetical protein
MRQSIFLVGADLPSAIGIGPVGSEYIVDGPLARRQSEISLLVLFLAVGRIRFTSDNLLAPYGRMNRFCADHGLALRLRRLRLAEVALVKLFNSYGMTPVCPVRIPIKLSNFGTQPRLDAKAPFRATNHYQKS